MSDGVTNTPTVLISSAGRRVELLRAFRTVVTSFDPVTGQPSGSAPAGRVVAVDCSWYSSAFHDADAAHLVPRCNDPAYVPRLLEICRDEQVDLVIPTIDPELPVYAEAREQFAELGTTVAISAPEVIRIAADKQATHDWLVANGFPTVRQGTPTDVESNRDEWAFPLIVKPRFGSASVGVRRVEDLAQLRRAIADHRADGGDDAGLVVQELAQGTEHTIDVLVVPTEPAGVNPSEPPTVAVAVPRRRIEVRAGEVSKGVTVRSPELIELATKLATALPGARGPLNVQVFSGHGQLAVIEINARFGGGFPLSYAAGADMPRALLQEARGLPPTASLDWRDDVMMLRYDAAVFIDGSVP